jgi:hypothetical protein
MYAQRYTNKRGQEKIEVLVTLEEAKRVVELSPEALITQIRRAIEGTSEQDFRPRGTPGRLEGLEMLFNGLEDQLNSEEHSAELEGEPGGGEGVE